MAMELKLLGEEYDGDYRQEVLKHEPARMNEAHRTCMLEFYKVMYEIKTKSKRDVPITLGELEGWGFKKKIIKELVEFGYLKITPARLINKTTNVSTGIRNLVYWTPQGRAYSGQFGIESFRDTLEKQPVKNVQDTAATEINSEKNMEEGNGQ